MFLKFFENFWHQGEFSKISKIRVIPSFSTFLSKQKVLKRGTGYGVIFQFFGKNAIFRKITEISNFRSKRKMAPESCSSLQYFSNYVFVCSKKLKMKELDEILKFPKFPPSPHNFKKIRKTLV